MTKNVSQKKNWRTSEVQTHVDPPPVPLIKIKNDIKVWKYCVKMKLRRDPTLEKSDLYKLKCPCLKTANQRSSCYSCETLKLRSKHQGLLYLTKIYSIYVQYYTESTALVWYCVWSSGTYDHGTFKPIHFGLSYVLSLWICCLGKNARCAKEWGIDAS